MLQATRPTSIDARAKHARTSTARRLVCMACICYRLHCNNATGIDVCGTPVNVELQNRECKRFAHIIPSAALGSLQGNQ